MDKESRLYIIIGILIILAIFCWIFLVPRLTFTTKTDEILITKADENVKVEKDGSTSIIPKNELGDTLFKNIVDIDNGRGLKINFQRGDGMEKLLEIPAFKKAEEVSPPIRRAAVRAKRGTLPEYVAWLFEKGQGPTVLPSEKPTVVMVDITEGLDLALKADTSKFAPNANAVYLITNSFKETISLNEFMALKTSDTTLPKSEIARTLEECSKFYTYQSIKTGKLIILSDMMENARVSMYQGTLWDTSKMFPKGVPDFSGWEVTWYLPSTLTPSARARLVQQVDGSPSPVVSFWKTIFPQMVIPW